MGLNGGGKRFVSDLEAAPFLGLSVQTLRNWRIKEINPGPPFVRLGTRTIRYAITDLEAYIADNRVDCGDEAGR